MYNGDGMGMGGEGKGRVRDVFQVGCRSQSQRKEPWASFVVGSGKVTNLILDMLGSRWL